MDSSSFLSPTCTSPRVTVVGAGRVGSTLAQKIAEKNIADVVLLDIVAGMPQGLALDLMEARGLERQERLIAGTVDYKDTAGSDIVVITAGVPRKPGLTREDLVKINAKIVVEAAQKAIAQSPNAVLIVVTNPLDVMTYLAWEASGLPARRVVGMGGVLDAARFQTFIAMELGVSVQDIQTMVVGDHGQLMVPLPRYCTVRGIPIAELMSAEAIARLVERTRNGGAEIVQLMQTGSAFFAPAASAALMVEAILQNQPRVVPAAAYLQGEYGLEGLFLGVPCQLGCRGVEKVIELHLTDEERTAFMGSVASVQKNVAQAKELIAAAATSV